MGWRVGRICALPPKAHLVSPSASHPTTSPSFISQNKWWHHQTISSKPPPDQLTSLQFVQSFDTAYTMYTHWSRLLMKLHVFFWLKREASGKNPGEIGKTEECKTSIFRAPAGRSILCNHLPSKGLSSRKSANPYPCHLTVSINLTSYHLPKESPNHQHNHRHHYYRCHILIPEISWANEQYGVLQS